MIEYAQHFSGIESQIEVWFDVIEKIMFLREEKIQLIIPQDSVKIEKEKQVQNFMIHLYPRIEVNKRKNPEVTKVYNTLSFLCLSAGVGFSQINALEPRSIILTSGTLQPLDTFGAEL